MKQSFLCARAHTVAHCCRRTALLEGAAFKVQTCASGMRTCVVASSRVSSSISGSRPSAAERAASDAANAASAVASAARAASSCRPASACADRNSASSDVAARRLASAAWVGYKLTQSKDALGQSSPDRARPGSVFTRQSTPPHEGVRRTYTTRAW
eukprot:360598-Chlamydomonas_euryale.AAC.5